ncbi:MAG TPA: type II secretion system F family protein [Thermoleophilaceae bacterium]
MSAGLAFVAGCCGLLAAVDLFSLASGALPGVSRRVRPLLRVGDDGRDPGVAERRRLLVVGAVLAFAAATFALGPIAGVAAGAAGPFAVSRLLEARRQRWRRRLDTGAAAAALALADAIRGGHSLHGALLSAAPSMGGAAGTELRRCSLELQLGAPVDEALERLRARAASRRYDTLVAACLLQRRAGGDLAALLRECARSFEDEERLLGDARAATAQARFTGLVVVMLPLGGAFLAELARPGVVASLAASALTAWLAGLALALQLAAAFWIRRLGRVRA